LKDGFGKRLRKLREEKHPDLSLRKLAEKSGVNVGYLSKIERELERASDDTILALARALGESPDILFAMDGRASARLQRLMSANPELFSELMDHLERTPGALLRIVREVKDGKW
jgi:transcriptional regulator with XRE-family HTH domain